MKRRGGFLGNLGGGLAALFQRETDIAPRLKSTSDYDRVMVGTPVWFGNIPPAVRSWLAQHRRTETPCEVSFFCTFAGKGEVHAGKKLKGLAPTPWPEPACIAIKNGTPLKQTEGQIKAYIKTLEL